MPNDIATKQNSAEAITLLRAVRHAYSKAKRIGLYQLSLSVVAVVASPVAAHFAPGAKAYVAIYGALVLIVDLIFLEPMAVKQHTAGAKFQERFDELVLSFPWRSRHRPEVGSHVALAMQHELSGEDGAKLENWYPAAVARLPIEQGRLACQRTNLQWDSKLREQVWKGYVALLLALGVGALVYAKMRALSTDAAIVEVLMPVVPLGVRWAKKIVDHKAAAEGSEHAKQRVDRVWAKVAAQELTPKQLDDESRELQEEIYERRVRSPQVPDVLYRLLRNDDEQDMTAAAEAMTEEALRAPPPSSTP